MKDCFSPQSDSDWEGSISHEEEIYLDESSVDDSDLDNALFGILPKEDGLSFPKRKKHSKRKCRAAPYSQKVKTKIRRKTAATPTHMSAEIKELMQVVFDAYLGKDFAKAIQVLEEIVRRSPGLHDPLHWLGLIYEKEYNDKRKAINYYFLAAHLVPKDAMLWKQIGQMSEEMGNINQAIYCYRRYQRNCTESMDASTEFRLAKCLALRGEYKHAVHLLRGLFDGHFENCELTLELSHAYTQIDEAMEAMQSLEMHIKAFQESSSLPHLACISQVCDFYLKFCYLEKCRDLVKSVCDFSPTALKDKQNFEILVKCAVAEIQLGEYSTAISVQPLLWDASLLSLSSSTRNKYFLLFGDAYYNRGIFSEALHHFLSICETPEMATENAIWIKMANCQIEMRNLEAAADILKRCIATNDSLQHRTAGISDAEVRLKYCEVLTLLGKIDEADEMLVSVGYKDLREADTLPKPMIMKERERLLNILSAELQKFKEETTTETSPETTSKIKKKKNVWTAQFFRLIEESELDTQRVIRQSYQKKVELSQTISSSSSVGKLGLPSTSSNSKNISTHASPPLGMNSFSSSSFILSPDESVMDVSLMKKTTLPHFNQDLPQEEDIQTPILFDLQRSSLPHKRKEIPRIVHFSKLKKEMGLHSLEDFLGWKNYAHFLCDGISIVKECFRLKEGVELLETILSNKKQDRSQLLDSDKRYFKEIVEGLSLNLSMEAKLYRVALSHIRSRYMQKPEDGNRLLALFNKILFSGEFSHHCIHSLSTGPEKEILLENRSWAIRQLLQRPYSFCLIVIVSHFCLLSSRWPFAVAEYIRAHRLLPHDDLICLSLAAAYINFSTSRSVQNRHAVVLRGFTMLNRYLTLRLHSAHMQFIPPHRKTFLEAENAYNLARAYHQLSLFYLSIPLYLKSLQILDTLRDFEKTLESFPVVELTTEAQRGAFVRSLLMDIRQLTLCAAYNLYVIWKSQRRKTQALWVSNKYLVWT